MAAAAAAAALSLLWHLWPGLAVVGSVSGAQARAGAARSFASVCLATAN